MSKAKTPLVDHYTAADEAATLTPITDARSVYSKGLSLRSKRQLIADVHLLELDRAALIAALERISYGVIDLQGARDVARATLAKVRT
jgi:hypothetical protein